jgi:hypothetical protein
MVTYRNIYGCVYVHMLVQTYMLCLLRGPKSNGNLPVTVSISNAQILGSKTIVQLKELRLLGGMTGHRTRKRNIQDESKIHCSTKNVWTCF